MKATTLISALVFACGAFAQASESASTSVSAGGKSASKSGTQTSSAASTQPSSTGGSDSLSESRTTLIPSTISEGCSSFLNKLNADKDLAACLGPLANAVSAYSGSGGSASGLSATLDSLCAPSNSCSRETMVAKLTEFKDSCTAELIGSNTDETVKSDYDVLYAVIPFRDAVCSKVGETYCLLDSKAGSTAANTTSKAAATSASSRRKRAQTVLVPNAKAYRNGHLLYLSVAPTLAADQLCTECTKQIFAKYFSFQATILHAFGAKNSPLLGDQNAFRSEFSQKCPKGYEDSIYAIANVQTAKDVNSALPAFAGSIFTAVAGALAVVALI